MIRKRQYAALPFVKVRHGIKICLITSRETGRWIIPKGWPQRGLRPHKLAALEAYEEAGLKGQTARDAIGSFSYIKIMDDGSEAECDVTVYPMLVEEQAESWPEQSERKVNWVKLKKAIRMVDDEGLSELLRNFTPPAA